MTRSLGNGKLLGRARGARRRRRSSAPFRVFLARPRVSRCGQRPSFKPGSSWTPAPRPRYPRTLIHTYIPRVIFQVSGRARRMMCTPVWGEKVRKTSPPPAVGEQGRGCFSPADGTPFRRPGRGYFSPAGETLLPWLASDKHVDRGTSQQPWMSQCELWRVQEPADWFFTPQKQRTVGAAP